MGIKNQPSLGRGGDQVVSVLAFYSDDPSSNPAEAYSFFCNIVFVKNRNKEKEAGVGLLYNKGSDTQSRLKYWPATASY